MDVDNVARDFLRRLEAGEFDGRVSEEAAKLSHEELVKVTTLLSQRDSFTKRPVVLTAKPRRSASYTDSPIVAD
jgi:hypothetical protein